MPLEPCASVSFVGNHHDVKTSLTNHYDNKTSLNSTPNPSAKGRTATLLHNVICAHVFVHVCVCVCVVVVVVVVGWGLWATTVKGVMCHQYGWHWSSSTYWQGKTRVFFLAVVTNAINHQHSFIVYPFATLPHPLCIHAVKWMQVIHFAFFLLLSFRPDRPKSSLFPSSSPQLRHPLTP